jgi:hypothetical protein
MPGLLLQTVHVANDAHVRVKTQEPLDRAIDTSSARVELGDRRPTPQGPLGDALRPPDALRRGRRAVHGHIVEHWVPDLELEWAGG